MAPLGKLKTFTVELKRASPSEQWGFSLVGGADQNAPLIVTRVGYNSPVANTLQRGDVIKKIGNYDGRDIRHQDAQNLFKNAGTSVKVVVQREPALQATSTGSSRCSSHTVSPALSPRGPEGPGGLPGIAQQQCVSPPTLIPAAPAPPAAAPVVFVPPPPAPAPVYAPSPVPVAFSPVPPQQASAPMSPIPPQHFSAPMSPVQPGFMSPTPQMQQYMVPPPQPYVPQAMQQPVPNKPYTTIDPVTNLPVTHIPEGYWRTWGQEIKQDENDIENVLNQPYRTTPLVLPGAKVKRDHPIESYLRHHPNPSVRSAPHHIDTESMKQKVADSVIQKVVTENQSNVQIAHKQFNSPIQLYTEANIADTIKSQAGITAPNGTYIPKGKCISKKYDPMLSETYKAVQEEENDMQDVSPIAPKVYTPPGPRVIQPKKQVIHHPPPHSPPQQQQHHLNSLGAPSDAIQQSGSFKRLMYHVMADI